jgi:hypothetical protein
MSTTRQLLQDSNNPVHALTNTNLASLTSTNTVLGSAFSNVQADGAGLGYAYCRARLTLGAPGTTWTAGSAMYVWFLTELDGSNYETTLVASGTTSANPPVARAPDLIIPLDSPATPAATVRDVECAVPNCAAIKAFFWNNGGQTIAATGNLLDLYFYTDQQN